MNVSGTTIVTDNPNKRGESHLMDCLRYLCAYEPQWHEPAKKAVEEPWWVEWQKRKNKNQQSVIHLAPNSYSGVFYA